MSSTVIWLTGLPGSGKSTVAEELKKIRPEFVVLRMDEFRKIVTPEPTYSETERDLVYRGLVFLAKTMAEHGHPVIIDATGNRRIWRDLARRLMPGFMEVYLRCRQETCSLREAARSERHGAPLDIYRKGKEGWPVPGVNVPYEEPEQPELVIDTEIVSPREAAAVIAGSLNRDNPLRL